MEMSIAEIADRFTILKLKVERLPENDDIIYLFSLFNEELGYELSKLSSEIKASVEKKIQALYNINAVTWSLEAEIRRGAIDEEKYLEEIGRRTILIRDNNKKRVAIKNDICKLVGHISGLDIKIDHRSE